jgi:spermidine/putrescine transport system ATP-binding protein
VSEHLIELKDLTMVFEDGYTALDGINLSLNRNEFLTLLGPSGCGKTTTLRLVGGFAAPTSGDVLYMGKSIVHLPPYKRNINTVFQRYALFPHMNVAQNIAFGPDLRRQDKRETARQVADMLALVGLRGFEKRAVASLSGGQQQRVAIARALINKPAVLLLDEPLGALDLKLRKEMQVELKRIQVESGITFLYVTHDQEEALTMSDTVVVMRGGQVQQVGTPQDIYNEPVNAFVADFIGESNILAGTMIADRRAFFLGHPFECVDSGFGEDAPVDVVLRPEDVKLKSVDAPIPGAPRGVVISTLFKGVHYEMRVSVGADELLVHSTHAREPGTPVQITVAPSDIQIMRKSDMSPDAPARAEEAALPISDERM